MHFKHPRGTHFSLLFAIGMAALAGVGHAGKTMAAQAATTPAQVSTACPSAKKLRPLLKLGSIYLGELHGTKEAPTLVRCLADADVAAGVTPLFVSLELPSFARDTNGPIWTGRDGRTSVAMMSLVQHLESLEKQGKLTLDFQLTDNEQGDVQMNKQVGEHLRDLAAKGRLIALGGNLHSQRKQAMIPSLTFAPAGAFVGDGVKTVMLVSASGGTAWNCMDTCAAHSGKGFTGIKAGDLVDGSNYGHDYLYGLAHATASAPARVRATPPPPPPFH